MNSIFWFCLAMMAYASNCYAESAQVGLPRYYEEQQRQPEQQSTLASLSQTIQTALQDYGPILVPIIAIVFFIYAYVYGYSVQETNEIFKRR